MSNSIPAISINHKLVTKENATVSIFDHGFLYGDGVFEGIRVFGDRIFRGKRHVDRLYRSAKAIGLDIGISKEEMLDEICKVSREWGELNNVDLHKNEESLYVRAIVSRGDGDLGLDPRKCPKPNIIVVVDKITLYPKEWYENGLKLVTTSVKRNLPDALSPQIKSLNYLNNIMAKIIANEAGAAEAIFLNHMGYVSEATADNIFIVKNGKLITPPESDGALPGITREAVLELAVTHGIPHQETHITVFDLYSAEECFVTGTAARIAPVANIDTRSIGDTMPGKITKQLMKELDVLTQNDGVPVFEPVKAS